MAIYPSEGTFPSEHPLAVIRRPCVTDEDREAGELYIRYLRDRKQQEAAQAYGFRPTNPSIPLTNLIRKEMGVDPEQRRGYLKPPQASAFAVINDAWSRNKRPADIVLVVDISESMKKTNKMRRVEEATQLFVEMPPESDTLSVLLFGADVEWQPPRGLAMNTKGKAAVHRMLKDIPPFGDMALYAAVVEAHQYLCTRDPSRNRAIVLLSDGNDTKHEATIDDVIQRVKLTASNPIHILAIAYGSDADPKTLDRVAKATEAESFEDVDDRSPTQNIREIFLKIVTFF